MDRKVTVKSKFFKITIIFLAVVLFFVVEVGVRVYINKHNEIEKNRTLHASSLPSDGNEGEETGGNDGEETGNETGNGGTGSGEENGEPSWSFFY